MTSAYTSTAYLGPIQLYTKYGTYDRIFLETEENYMKQTYRNRCLIAGAVYSGPLLPGIPGQTRISSQPEHCRSAV